MSRRFKLTIVLTAIFIVAALFLGTATPKAVTSVHSPYVSALSSYAVGTAVAASHGCTNSGCEAIQGIVGCHAPEFPGTNCAVVNGVCTTTACKGH
jgi:hypothetical protein